MQARCFGNGIAIRYRDDGVNGKNEMWYREIASSKNIFIFII